MICRNLASSCPHLAFTIVVFSFTASNLCSRCLFYSHIATIYECWLEYIPNYDIIIKVCIWMYPWICTIMKFECLLIYWDRGTFCLEVLISFCGAVETCVVSGFLLLSVSFVCFIWFPLSFVICYRNVKISFLLVWSFSTMISASFKFLAVLVMEA